MTPEQFRAMTDKPVRGPLQRMFLLPPPDIRFTTKEFSRAVAWAASDAGLPRLTPDQLALLTVRMDAAVAGLMRETHRHPVLLPPHDPEQDSAFTAAEKSVIAPEVQRIRDAVLRKPDDPDCPEPTVVLS